MRYFIPSHVKGWSIKPEDKAIIANWSSRGIKHKEIDRPPNPTQTLTGVQALISGKTYRDLQITEWKDAVSRGYLTKSEIYESLPEWIRKWAESKLKNTPYDIHQNATKYFIAQHRREHATTN
jgi:hypothetical protein